MSTRNDCQSDQPVESRFTFAAGLVRIWVMMWFCLGRKPLYQLIYMSVESHEVTEQDLADLLEQARTRNAELAITGMLLYRDGFFLQAIEGERSDVEAVYRSISLDARHTGLYVIEQSDIDARRFSDWRMGYRNLSGTDPGTAPGAGQLFDRESVVKQVPNHRDLAVDLLAHFAEA